MGMGFKHSDGVYKGVVTPRNRALHIDRLERNY